MATGSPKLDYSDLPPGTRISCEDIENGVRITMRGSGFWYEMRWAGLIMVACCLPMGVAWAVIFVRNGYSLFPSFIPPEIRRELYARLWVQGCLFLPLGPVVMSVMAAIFGNLSYEIEMTDTEMTIVGRLWRLRWQRMWPKNGIRKISRFAEAVRIRGHRGLPSAGIHGRRADVKWLHRRLTALLLERGDAKVSAG